jgi:long-subunit fatty acid transport protein
VAGVAAHQVQTFERSLLFKGENDANSITDYFMPLPGEFELDEDNQGVFPTFSRSLSFIAFETYAIDLDQGLLDDGDPVPFLPAVSFGTVRQTGFVEEQGRMTEINIGGGVEVAPDVMVGLSLNIPFGTYTFTRVHEEEDFLNDNDGVSNGTTDFDYLRFTESFESDILGVNLRTGVSAEVADGARVGVTVETPTYFSVQDKFDTILRTEFDNGDVYVYGDNRDEREGSGEFDYEIISPWKLALGGSYARSGLTVAADAEWVDWSQLELSASDFSYTDENLAIRRGLDAVINARLGVSYEMNGIIVRGGYAIYPDPHDNAPGAIDTSRPDRDRTFFSAGLGYRFTDRVRADAGWIQERFDDRYRPYTEVDGAPVVSEQMTRNRFMLGFTFGF